MLVSEDLVPCALLDFSLPSPGLSNTIDFTESSGSDDVLKPIDEELVVRAFSLLWNTLTPITARRGKTTSPI